MDARELEAARGEHSRRHAIRPAPTFEGDRLVFGAATEVASVSGSVHRESRAIAILSAAYSRPVDARAFSYLRRALGAQARGDAVLAALHIAMAGFGTLARPEAAARRAFLSDRLLRLGATPKMILEAVGIDAGIGALTKYDESEPRNPAGDGRQSGEWTDGDPGSFFSSGLRREALAALARWAAKIVGPTSAALSLGLLVLSTSRTAHDGNGKVPGHDDVAYDWDTNNLQMLPRSASKAADPKIAWR